MGLHCAIQVPKNSQQKWELKTFQNGDKLLIILEIVPLWGQKATNFVRKTPKVTFVRSGGKPEVNRSSGFCGQNDGVKNRKENTKHGVEKGWIGLELNILDVVPKKNIYKSVYSRFLQKKRVFCSWILFFAAFAIYQWFLLKVPYPK